MNSEPQLKAFSIEWETIRGAAGFNAGVRRICASSEASARAIAPAMIAHDLNIAEGSIRILRVTPGA